MGDPWASTFDITKACPTTQTSCTASTRGLRELCLIRTSSCTWTFMLTAGQSSLFCSLVSLKTACFLFWLNTLRLSIEGHMRDMSLTDLAFCENWVFYLGMTLDCSTWGYTFHRAIQNDRDPRWFSAPGNAETNWSGLDLWGLASNPLTESFPFLWFVSMSLASLCSWMVKLVPYNFIWGSVIICPVNIYLHGIWFAPFWWQTLSDSLMTLYLSSKLTRCSNFNIAASLLI